MTTASPVSSSSTHRLPCDDYSRSPVSPKFSSRSRTSQARSARRRHQAGYVPGMAARDDELIELRCEKEFSATVRASEWPVVGAPATVRRRVPQQSWPGVVVGFAPSVLAKAEWRLKSGDLRSAMFYSKGGDGKPLGHQFDVPGRGNQLWTATIPSGSRSRSFEFVTRSSPGHGSAHSSPTARFRGSPSTSAGSSS